MKKLILNLLSELRKNIRILYYVHDWWWWGGTCLISITLGKKDCVITLLSATCSIFNFHISYTKFLIIYPYTKLFECLVFINCTFWIFMTDSKYVPSRFSSEFQIVVSGLETIILNLILGTLSKMYWFFLLAKYNHHSLRQKSDTNDSLVTAL